jgi:hypothetical protein
MRASVASRFRAEPAKIVEVRDALFMWVSMPPMPKGCNAPRPEDIGRALKV